MDEGTAGKTTGKAAEAAAETSEGETILDGNIEEDHNTRSCQMRRQTRSRRSER